MYRQEGIADLKGKTLASVDVNRALDVIEFVTTDGDTYRMYHSQDCCESVQISEVIGEVSDLVGSPLLEAEEISSENEPAPPNAESYTWTFYKLGTIKGHVTLRWLGESNGYYSESVDFRKIND